MKLPVRVTGNVWRQDLKSALKEGHWPRRKPRSSKDSRKWEGMRLRSELFHGKLQISFLVGGGVAAEYTREGEGHADEGWCIDKEVVSKTCTVFDDVLFETVVKSS